jgi:MarR family transcriptional regulator, organic hydroperoxide resistance regulator
MRADEAFSYRTWPFYWLARAAGRYRSRMEEALRPLGIDMPRWRVLMTLHEDRVASVSEIAEHSSAKLPTMVRIIQRMEADGLVERRQRAGNDRVMEVVLTPAGEEAGDRAWAAAALVYQQAFGTMAEEDLERLKSLLGQLAANLG